MSVYKRVYTLHMRVYNSVYSQVIPFPRRDCMKKRINITLSEEALKIADESNNRSEWIEYLIMEGPRAEQPQATPVTLKQLVEVINQLKEDLQKNNVSATQKTSVPPLPPVSSIPVRSPSDILADIDNKKLELSQLMEVNQDPEEHRNLQKEIQELWVEYHATKTDM